MGELRALDRRRNAEEAPGRHCDNDAANRYLNRVQVVPVASTVSKLYPSEARITVGRRQSKAMADQIATVSKERLLRRAGNVSPLEMRDVERAIRVQLGLSQASGPA